jgi:DNA-binding GntR family transcriptional regulator
VKEEDILAFVGATLKSLWALELLLLMRRAREHAWRTDQLVAELRASTAVIRESLAHLTAAGLVAEEDKDAFCYRPASEQLDSFVAEAQALYAAKPLAVINAIAAAPNEKLRIFADAFRLK